MLAPNAVFEAVRLTFEEMAFLDVADGPSAEASESEGPVLFLSYSRPTSGSLSLVLPKEIKFAVAEAIYGEDWDTLSSVQLDDSLLELLNVLAGRLLTARFGEGEGYTMGLPTVLYDPPVEPAGSKRQAFVFHVDSNEFQLVWYEVQA